MNIKKNIELVGKISKSEVSQEKVGELLSLIGLPNDILDKRVDQLSGGQQQRIGLARALATDPDIILMDEPFSALDNITRNQLQDDFKNLKHLEDKTILLVTHDVQEAFKLGDKILLLEEGEVQQYGTPLDLLNRPATEKVEAFLQKDRFILSLQTASYQEHSLFDYLNDNSVNHHDKKVAMEGFFKQVD